MKGVSVFQIRNEQIKNTENSNEHGTFRAELLVHYMLESQW